MFGMIAGLIGVILYLPQLYTVCKTRQLGLNPITYYCLLIVSTLWILHGYVIDDITLVVVNSVLLTQFIVLGAVARK